MESLQLTTRILNYLTKSHMLGTTSSAAIEQHPPSMPAARARARKLSQRSCIALGILTAVGVLKVIQDLGDVSRLRAGDILPAAPSLRTSDRDRAEQLLEALQRNQTEHKNETRAKLSHLAKTAGSSAATPKFPSKTAGSPTPTSESKTRNFDHFLMHIPKSGTSHAFNEVRRLVSSGPDSSRTVPCNLGALSLQQLDKVAREREKCDMWMTEQPYSDRPRNTYAILRDPRSHALSMYFHCTESGDHENRAHLMPSLDEWLRGWVDAKRNTDPDMTSVEQQERFRNRTRCYNPINSQLRYIGNPFTIRGGRHVPFHSKLAEGSNITATSSRGMHSDYRIFKRFKFPPGTKYVASPEGLRKRYAVLGDQSQMDKTICMIQIHYKGYVTKPCDCTNVTAITAGNTTDEAVQRVDHGVTHHGDSFETTPEQDDMIAILRDYDTALYEESRKIFATQVRETEEKYGVKICDKITTPITNGLYVIGN